MGKVSPEEIKRQTRELFAAMHSEEKGTPKWLRARNKIITLNDGLARRVALRYTATNYPEEDLLQLARIGLIKAVDKYDPATKNAFSSIAVPFCLGAIQHHLRDYETPIKARMWRESRDRVAAIQNKMHRLYGVSVPAEQIALNREGFTPQKWEQVQALVGSKHTKSLDEPTAEGETLASSLAAGVDLTPEEEEQRYLEKVALLGLINQLPGQDQIILRSVYWDDLKPAAIARCFGTTEAVIQGQLDLAHKKLRELVNGRVDSCKQAESRGTVCTAGM